MQSTLQVANMSKQASTDTPAKAAQSSIQTPNIEKQQTPEVKTEETQNSNLYNVVRKLTTRLKPAKEKEASPPEASESAEDKLAGSESKTPDLYAPTKGAQKEASLETAGPLDRTTTLSKAQREPERLENLILNPTSIKEVEEQEKAEDTLKQSRGDRFQNFLEEHF